MKSKFTFWAYLMPFLTIAFIGLSFSLFWSLLTKQTNQDPSILYFVATFMLFCAIWLVFGELRTKIIAVNINSNNIQSSSLLGLGTEQEFSFKELDGFTLALLPSRGGTYEYLYLMDNNKKVIKLSEFYHENYYELKQEISRNSKFLGHKRFSYLTELKEIFT